MLAGRLPSCLVDDGGNDKVTIHPLASSRGAIVVCPHDLIFKQGRQEPALRLLAVTLYPIRHPDGTPKEGKRI